MRMRVIGAIGSVVAVAILAQPLAADDTRETVMLGQDDLTAGVPGKGPLTLEQVKKWLDDERNHRILDVQLPLGLAAASNQIQGLDKNPMTRAKIELGRQLYFDPRLSLDGTVSCATCHNPDEGYSHRTRFGIGVNSQEGDRNSPISYNRILSGAQFWDGRAASLEEQAVGPIANPVEMANTHDACVECLKGIPEYVVQFDAIFGKNSLNIETVAKAIATFERALVTGPTPYDYSEAFSRFAKLDPDDLSDLLEADEDFKAEYTAARAALEAFPMTDSAKRGQVLFFSERINCATCHVGANLADELYHNLGVGMDAEEPDVGRFAVTKEAKDWGAFKTPTIRNVEFSGPYMHDGSLETLMDVVEHYNKGGTPNKNLSDKIFKLNLTEQEKIDLVEFMKACTGSFPKVETGRLPQ